MNLDAYRIDSEPFYQSVGDEIAVFEAAFHRAPARHAEGANRLRQNPVCRTHGVAPDKPLITVAAHEDMTASDLAGRYLLEPGGTIWQRWTADHGGETRRDLLPR